MYKSGSLRKTSSFTNSNTDGYSKYKNDNTKMNYKLVQKEEKKYL